MQTGSYVRYDLLADEQSRFCGASKYVRGVNDISINVLELLGMVAGAWVLIVASSTGRSLRAIVLCCQETMRPVWHGFSGMGVVKNLGLVR